MAVPANLLPFVSFLGVILQFVGALFLVVLFSLLRGYARRRKYFLTWGQAWIALATSVGAAFAAALIATTGASSADAAISVLHFIHQYSGVLYVGLLVAGTALYARQINADSVLVTVLLFGAGYSMIAMALSSIEQALLWHAPVALVAHAWAGSTLLRLPPSRRALGSNATGIAFILSAVVAALYLAGLTGDRFGFGVPGLIDYHTYIDLLTNVLLGFGMFVILMEDAKREVDDAHAELAVAHDDLRRSALYDAVTGTLNRRAFAEGVGLETAKAKYGAVLLLDLDNLKNVNDEYGHAAGDALLHHLADVLRPVLRPSDKMYRWGGDEFLLVLPGASAPKVEARLRSVLEGARRIRFGDPPVPIRLGVSLGVAAYLSGEKMEGAIKRADEAMYREKHRKKTADPRARG